MGTVYKAIQKSLNREVALKVLDPMVGPESEEASKRFNLEAQSMKKLDHQNLVQVFDFGYEGNQSYIAMTYVPGQTLADILKKRKRLDLAEALLIIKMVARGLMYAHAKGVVHRDIKPSNIMLSPDNTAKVMDFGISHNQGSERITSTGTAMGTPEYMSPEQCKGEEVTLQSDIYSLGIVFYEMLCGDPPFTGVKAIDIAYKQVHSLPEPPSHLCSQVTPALDSLILKCLSKNRSDRFSSTAQFLEELDMVTEPDTPQTGKGNSHKAPTRKLPSIIDKKDPQTWLLPLAFGLIAILIILQALLILAQKKESSSGLLTNFELSGAWEQRALETDHPDGYPLANLIDNDLQTAWLLPSVDITQNPVLVLHFDKPVLVLNVGLAIGYQKSKDDNLQDRFTMFQKPQNIMVRSLEGSVQKLSLQNIKGVQYPSFIPVETQEIRLELREQFPGSTPESDLAIAELRIVGTTLPESK